MKDFLPVEHHKETIQLLSSKRRVKTKIIYTTVLFMITCVILSFPFIYIDVSIQSRGVINSNKINNTLQSAIYAKIEWISMYENMNVRKNDTLIVLNTEELDEQLLRLDKRIEENKSFIRDMTSLIQNKGALSSLKYVSENIHFKAKIREIDEQINLLEGEYNASKQLYEKGVEAKLDFKQAKSKFQSSCLQKEIIINQFKNSWQAEVTRLELEIKDLESQIYLIQKRKDQYVIVAPIKGKIIGFLGYQKGNFIQPGQTFAQISNSDSLIIECYVSPADIGYINIGQKAQVQVDTYNYQQWGLLDAYVHEIISDVVEVNKMPFFKVKCITSKNYLTLSNGYRGEIKKGMSVTARLFLTKRSLSQLLFDQIDNWMNPKIKVYANQN